jgi:hypothetical protein
MITKDIVEEMLDNRGTIITHIASKWCIYVAIEFPQNINTNSFDKECLFFGRFKLAFDTHPISFRIRRLGQNRIFIGIDWQNVFDTGKFKTDDIGSVAFTNYLIEQGKNVFDVLLEKGICADDIQAVSTKEIFQYPTNKYINKRMEICKESWNLDNLDVIILPE